MVSQTTGGGTSSEEEVDVVCGATGEYAESSQLVGKPFGEDCFCRKPLGRRYTEKKGAASSANPKQRGWPQSVEVDIHAMVNIRLPFGSGTFDLKRDGVKVVWFNDKDQQSAAVPRLFCSLSLVAPAQ